MNWYKISQNTDINNEIKNIIKYFNDNEYDLASGNCGQFAIALGLYFNDYNPILVIATDLDEGEKLDFDFEGHIYHVAIEINNVLYDYRGMITQEDMAKFVFEVYGNPKAHLSFISIDNSSIEFIKQNTNWDNSYKTFLNVINNIENNIFWGYKIVGYDPELKQFYSIYDKSVYDLKINNVYKNDNGIYLGTSKEFCLNYYSCGTEEHHDEYLLSFQYEQTDLISGDPYSESGEISVSKCILKDMEKIDKEEWC